MRPDVGQEATHELLTVVVDGELGRGALGHDEDVDEGHAHDHWCLEAVQGHQVRGPAVDEPGGVGVLVLGELPDGQGDGQEGINRELLGRQAVVGGDVVLDRLGGDVPQDDRTAELLLRLGASSDDVELLEGPVGRQGALAEQTTVAVTNEW